MPEKFETNILFYLNDNKKLIASLPRNIPRPSTPGTWMETEIFSSNYKETKQKFGPFHWNWKKTCYFEPKGNPYEKLRIVLMIYTSGCVQTSDFC